MLCGVSITPGKHRTLPGMPAMEMPKMEMPEMPKMEMPEIPKIPGMPSWLGGTQILCSVRLHECERYAPEATRWSCMHALVCACGWLQALRNPRLRAPNSRWKCPRSPRSRECRAGWVVSWPVRLLVQDVCQWNV